MSGICDVIEMICYGTQVYCDDYRKNKSIYVNIHGVTREQAEYNRYVPVLMTSVDTDPSLCAAERAAILQRLGAGEWKIFGAHGGMKEYRLREE